MDLEILALVKQTMAARTPESTEAEASSGTSSGTSSGDEEEEEEYLPPCRAAALAIVSCPLCGRQVTTKTLRYSHRCGRSFHTEAREEEQRKLAESAVRARMGQAREHRVEQRPLQAQAMEHRVEYRQLQTQPVEQRVAHGLEKYQQIQTNMHIYSISS